MLGQVCEFLMEYREHEELRHPENEKMPSNAKIVAGAFLPSMLVTISI